MVNRHTLLQSIVSFLSPWYSNPWFHIHWWVQWYANIIPMMFLFSLMVTPRLFFHWASTPIIFQFLANLEFQFLRSMKWVNYNNSLIWFFQAIWGWFPLLTIIPSNGWSYSSPILHPKPAGKSTLDHGLLTMMNHGWSLLNITLMVI